MNRSYSNRGGKNEQRLLGQKYENTHLSQRLLPCHAILWMKKVAVGNFSIKKIFQIPRKVGKTCSSNWIGKIQASFSCDSQSWLSFLVKAMFRYICLSLLIRHSHDSPATARDKMQNRPPSGVTYKWLSYDLALAVTGSWSFPHHIRQLFLLISRSQIANSIRFLRVYIYIGTSRQSKAFCCEENKY